MVLLDKGYFDYDYQKVLRPEDVVKWEDTVKTEEQLHDILSGFGFGIKKPKKPETLEEIQNYIRETEQWQ